MNEVIREFLHRFLTVYIDDILPKPGQTLSPCEAGPPETQTAPSLSETGEVRIPRFSSSATSSVKMVFLWTRGRWRPSTNSRFNSLWRNAQNSLRQNTAGLIPFQCILGYQPHSSRGWKSLRRFQLWTIGSERAREWGTRLMSTSSEQCGGIRLSQISAYLYSHLP